MSVMPWDSEGPRQAVLSGAASDGSRDESALPGIVSTETGYLLAMEFSRQYIVDATTPRLARTAARETFDDWGLARFADEVLLVLSELVTNAVRYGRGPIDITLGHAESRLLVAVRDRGTGAMPKPRQADANDENGRGMFIINTLSQRWGWAADDEGKTVWAELPMSR